MKLTVKHLTKEEINKCNDMLKNSGSVNSCSYQLAEKMVMEFVNAKEVMIIALARFNQFKNNPDLFQQVEAFKTKSEMRFNSAALDLGV